LSRSSRQKITNFYAYVEKVRKKDKKKERKKERKLAQDYMNAMLRTALKRKKGRKLAQDYINAVLRTALKKKKSKKTRVGLHECYASHRIKNKNKENSRRTT
jgi:hypothetical protein